MTYKNIRLDCQIGGPNMSHTDMCGAAVADHTHSAMLFLFPFYPQCYAFPLSCPPLTDHPSLKVPSISTVFLLSCFHMLTVLHRCHAFCLQICSITACAGTQGPIIIHHLCSSITASLVIWYPSLYNYSSKAEGRQITTFSTVLCASSHKDQSYHFKYEYLNSNTNFPFFH